MENDRDLPSIPVRFCRGSCGAGFVWDELSDTGGYAHLISAASQWLLGKNDWAVHQVPGAAAVGDQTILRAISRRL